jgi:hypothetical protein
MAWLVSSAEKNCVVVVNAGKSESSQVSFNAPDG